MKKGQLDFPLITLAVIIILMIMLGPIVLKVLNQFRETLTPTFGNMTYGAPASQASDKILGTAVNFMDGIMVFMFFTFVIVLLVSSMFIDTNPIFIFLYIIMAFLLVITAPNIADAMGNIYDSANFNTEVTQLQSLSFIQQHYGSILVGLIILSGIVMYGKIAFFKSGGGGRA